MPARRRARDEGGRLVGDDPKTPLVNEAWVEDQPTAPATGAEREVTPEQLEQSIGPDDRHGKRLEVAHRCAERFANKALPKVLPHDYAQGVQRLAEWLAFTGRGIDGELPAPGEIPAVVRLHWMVGKV